jgi:type IV secretion system protein VirB2
MTISSVPFIPARSLARAPRHALARVRVRALAAVVAAALPAAPVHAASTGAPWEAPLQSFVNSLTGPVAQMAGVAAVVIAGLGIAFSEGGSGLRRLVWVAMGLSIAFAATTFFLPLFGFAGGAVF